jgi:hypothetical protein
MTTTANPFSGLRGLALGLFAAVALSACGSGGGAGDSNLSSSTSTSSAATPIQGCAGCGTAMVTMTDAPGDFLSYIVNVLSLKLTRSDGTVVETVPVSTQEDFAQLVNLSDLISSEQLPAGQYVSATITLDYSAATIVVDNGSTGVTIAPANIIDGATSQPLAAPNPTQITLTLALGANTPLVITPNAVANLALDFNLLASNTITPSLTDPSTVTVNPTLTASLVPDASKPIRVGGPLFSVNVTGGSYLINVRPFFNASSSSGQLNVQTTGTTTYSINGMSFTGTAGLNALALQTAGTLTSAYGSWNQSAQTFTASNVLVGSSVAGNTLDSVAGTVTARSGDTLTLSNGLVLHAERRGLGFARQVSVTIGAGTGVAESGQSGSFSIQDISVGQRLQVSGTLGAAPLSDGAGSATLDATDGNALLLPSSVLGVATASTAALVTLDLQSVNGYAPPSLNFAGTGTSSAQDASAAAYTIALPAAISGAPVSVGSPVLFSGFVAPFGQAPPDFTASTLVSYADTRALLLLRWSRPGDSAPFATLTSSELLLSQATLQAAPEHQVRIGMTNLDPSTLSAGLQIVPNTAVTVSAFAIAHWSSRTIDNFSSFSDFVTALTSDLNGSNAVLQITADGAYAAATGVLSTDQMIAILNN